MCNGFSWKSFATLFSGHFCFETLSFFFTNKVDTKIYKMYNYPV